MILVSEHSLTLQVILSPRLTVTASSVSRLQFPKPAPSILTMVPPMVEPTRGVMSVTLKVTSNVATPVMSA